MRRELGAPVAIAVVLAAGCATKRSPAAGAAAAAAAGADRAAARPRDRHHRPRPRLERVRLRRPRRRRAPRSRVTADWPRPAPSRTMSEAEVTRVFGAALAALPPAAAPLHAVLPVRVGRADRRVARARSRDPEGRQGAAPFPRSSSSGTPTRWATRTGEPRARAEARDHGSRHPRRRRVSPPSTIEVTSHGEADLLVKTPRQHAGAPQPPRRDHGEVAGARDRSAWRAAPPPGLPVRRSFRCSSPPCSASSGPRSSRASTTRSTTSLLRSAGTRGARPERRRSSTSTSAACRRSASGRGAATSSAA